VLLVRVVPAERYGWFGENEEVFGLVGLDVFVGCALLTYFYLAVLELVVYCYQLVL
jgi:hypothetical protein